MLFCLIIVAALGIVAGIGEEKGEGFTADRHKSRGMSCVGCHKEAEPKTAADAKVCLACHKSLDAVAERTKDFEKNPHSNHITSSNDVQCTQCHQGHKADVIMCHSCHSGMTFERGAAE
jgi:fumarate reductase flavoprotein subunit